MDNFTKETDALKFIQDKLKEDILFKVNATYCLYEGADLMREFTQDDAAAAPASKDAPTGSSASGAGSRSSFTPTPFNNAPRPPGMPHSWIKDEDDKKK
jgi:hypothetical protein